MGPFELWGISGKMGVGKDFIAKALLNLLPPKRSLILGFADQLKINCIVHNGLDFRRAYIAKDQASRELLQKHGTQMRTRDGSDIFIRHTQSWMHAHHSRGIERFIISDLRFHNEMQWILQQSGTVIRVEAPHRNLIRIHEETNCNDHAISTHGSETDLDWQRNFHCTLHNDIGQEEVVMAQLKSFVETRMGNSSQPWKNYFSK